MKKGLKKQTPPCGGVLQNTQLKITFRTGFSSLFEFLTLVSYSSQPDI